MPEQVDLQQVPVKLYRTPDVVTAAAPMPGLEAENFSVEVAADGRLVLLGELRGGLKDAKEVLLEEWTAGPYWREIQLPCPVDGQAAIATYGNGVLVVALPVADRVRPAMLRLVPTRPTRGVRVPEEVAERRRRAFVGTSRVQRQTLARAAGVALIAAGVLRRGLLGLGMAGTGLCGLMRTAADAARARSERSVSVARSSTRRA